MDRADIKFYSYNNQFKAVDKLTVFFTTFVCIPCVIVCSRRWCFLIMFSTGRHWQQKIIHALGTCPAENFCLSQDNSVSMEKQDKSNSDTFLFYKNNS